MKNKILILSVMCLFAFLISGFGPADKTKNRKEASVTQKVEDILNKMTLDEKIGQMTQVDHDAIKIRYQDIADYNLGSILWGGNSELDDVTAKSWAACAESLQAYASKTRLKIPLLTGIDAVHGHNNVKGAVVFPHNVALGCTRDERLVEKAAEVTAIEMLGTGMNWAFAPCLAVARNERWGRTYESFGEDPELVAKLGAAHVRGLQGKTLGSGKSVLACAKHFMGDGGTTNGKDQGLTEGDDKTLRNIHLPGYISAIKNNVASVMVSYSSWNGVKMHGNKRLVDDLLKKELKFNGLIVSDWAGIDQLDNNYKKAIELAINAGIDMVMIPNGRTAAGEIYTPETKSSEKPRNTFIDFIKYLKELVQEGKVPMSRINDAVRRILTVKFKMDLFGKPAVEKNYTATVGSAEHRLVARECVRKSLVLLKNEKSILPLKNVKKLLVAGKNSHDIGNQCGGWTIPWQGRSGNDLTTGTTILDGIKEAAGKNIEVVHSIAGDGAKGCDAAIVVIGEKPYAEMFGDREDLKLDDEDIQVIKKIKAAGIPVVTVLLSGRPMIIEPVLNDCDAFVAAWLPGTEGNGVADVLLGKYNFTGKLSHSWPVNMKQVPVNKGDKEYKPLFPYGYGLTYAKSAVRQ